MIKWLVRLIQKEARRFQRDDAVRYFTQPRKGKGQGIVLTPSFRSGKIMDYDPMLRRYKVWDDAHGEEVMVHPRNLVPHSRSSPQSPTMPMETPQSIQDVAAVETSTADAREVVAVE